MIAATKPRNPRELVPKLGLKPKPASKVVLSVRLYSDRLSDDVLLKHVTDPSLIPG
jgi:hypothetical protein